MPVRDDVTRLRTLVARLGEQSLNRDRLEVVVGADGAPSSVAGLETADGWIRVVEGPPQNSYAARNRAARAARGDVLAFCDSDCMPSRAWLERGLAALRPADLVAGEVSFAAPPRPTVWSLLTVDGFLDQESNVRRYRAVTANLFVRRALFDAVGGFDESLPSGGDWELTQRAVARGGRLAYARDAVVRHPTLDDRRRFMRKLRTVNRCLFIRAGRSGRHRELVGLLTLVPLVGVALTRRNNFRPALRLSPRRLSAAGLEPSRWEELRAVLVLYTLAAYTTGIARADGWRDGRRSRRMTTGPAEDKRPHGAGDRAR